MSLAYEYCLAEEDQLALVMLTKAPPEYYQTVQPQQMEADPQYRDLVILLAYKLIQMGVVDGSEEVHTPTMAPGPASALRATSGATGLPINRDSTATSSTCSRAGPVASAALLSRAPRPRTSKRSHD